MPSSTEEIRQGEVNLGAVHRYLPYFSSPLAKSLARERSIRRTAHRGTMTTGFSR